MLSNLRHTAVLAARRAVYGSWGEPYALPGLALRYAPGTRPVRARYARSPNNKVRYDAMQVQLFSTALSEGDRAIDIGAHAGQ
jgi:hypothetical protein